MSRTALAPTLLLTLVLAACGGSDAGGGAAGGGEGPATPASILAKVITASGEPDSYKMSMEADMDFKGKEGRILMDGDIVSAADSSRGRFEGDMTFAGKEIPAEIVMVGKESWMRSKAFDALPKGKEWLHQTDDTTLSSTMTPAEFLDFLKDSPNIERLGTEEVRGVPSVRLRGPIDIEKLAQKTSSEAARMISRIRNLERVDMVIDIWASERDDRVTRMAFDMKVDGGVGGKMQVDADLLEWDVPLEAAEAPPERDTIDIAELE